MTNPTHKTINNAIRAAANKCSNATRLLVTKALELDKLLKEVQK